MARELIEVNPNDEPAVPPRIRTDRGREFAARNSADSCESRSAQSSDPSDSPPSGSFRRSAERSRKRAPVSDDLDDAIALDLEDDDEVQFLRAQRRVPVKRNVLPKKLAQKIRLAAVIVGAALVVGGVTATAYSYAMHSWRFRINSSENVEIAGVHNASRSHIMEIAGADIGRDIFFVPLE